MHVQAIIPVTYTIAVAQAAVTLGWPCQWIGDSSSSADIIRNRQLHEALRKDTPCIPLMALVLPLLSRLSALLDLAMQQPCSGPRQQSGLASKEGDDKQEEIVHGSFASLLTRLHLPSPREVVTGLLRHPLLPQALARCAHHCIE